MITEKNYVTIQGWMRLYLGLKGNELLAYALIYGFCQAKNEATLSIDYVAEWLGTADKGTRNILASLQGKKLIEAVRTPGKPSTYKVNFSTLAKAIGKAESRASKTTPVKSTGVGVTREDTPVKSTGVTPVKSTGEIVINNTYIRKSRKENKEKAQEQDHDPMRERASLEKVKRLTQELHL